MVVLAAYIVQKDAQNLHLYRVGLSKSKVATHFGLTQVLIYTLCICAYICICVRKHKNTNPESIYPYVNFTRVYFGACEVDL